MNSPLVLNTAHQDGGIGKHHGDSWSKYALMCGNSVMFLFITTVPPALVREIRSMKACFGP